MYTGPEHIDTEQDSIAYTISQFRNIIFDIIAGELNALVARCVRCAKIRLKKTHKRKMVSFMT